MVSPRQPARLLGLFRYWRPAMNDKITATPIEREKPKPDWLTFFSAITFAIVIGGWLGLQFCGR